MWYFCVYYEHNEFCTIRNGTIEWIAEIRNKGRDFVFEIKEYAGGAEKEDFEIYWIYLNKEREIGLWWNTDFEQTFAGTEAAADESN